MKRSKIPGLIGLAVVVAALMGGAYCYGAMTAATENPPAPPPNAANATAVLNPAEELGAKTSGAVILYLGSPVAYINNEQAFVDPLNPNTAPIIQNGRTIVPLRFITEGFGAAVDWNESAREVTITAQNKTITCQAGSNTLYVNGSAVQMDVAATMINDRMHLPLRAFADAIGKKVFYDEGLIIISDTENIYDPVKDRPTLENIIAKLNNLPLIGTKEKFVSLAGEPWAQSSQKNVEWFFEEDGAIAMDRVAGAGEAAAPEAAAEEQNAVASAAEAESNAGASADYSGTNVQVAGVDEADVIKTDGQYIYFMKERQLVVVNAVPADQMAVAYTVTFDDESFYPSEIYVDGDTLIVIGNAGKARAQQDDSYAFYDMAYMGGNITRAIVYDIADRTNVQKIREIDAEGAYVSSRKVGPAVYMITNLSAYALMADEDYILPAYRDTNIQEGYIDIGYDQMYYYPQIYDQTFTIVTGFTIDSPADTAKVNTYFGGGSNIYATADALYVAAVNYGYSNLVPEPIAIEPETMTGASPEEMKRMDALANMNSTEIYKFALNNGEVSYLYKGSVPGEIINQFSMDESGGYFRIATTANGWLEEYQYTQWNNLYVLDDAMTVVGQIEGIAPGERIYSTRFMGDRAYMVTFKTVDPLFVIDLSNPENPAILGELKIPGYSDYLHPYDETHLIGFGKDAIEYQGNAYYLGMKISMFDVSDVSQPKELFTELIGDRGTESELLNNHKALLFSKEKGLLAFPVSIAEVREGVRRDPFSYGKTVFQGAMVYSVDLDSGFTEKGRITHGAPDYGYDRAVQRILYIGDTLYTASNAMIRANNLTDLSETGSIGLE